MNKKLLAIGVAAGLAAPGAVLAEATLYGQVHVSVEYQDPDSNSDENVAVSDNSSRIGVKGSEDLGAGLKAIYLLEWAALIDDDNNNSRGLTRRNMYGGIQTDFGSFIVGRHDTPGKTVGRKADLFWSTQLGQNRTLTQGQVRASDGTTSISSGAGFDQRFDNTILYLSPDWGGFKLAAAYITDHDRNPPPSDAGTPDDNDNDAYSASLSYQGGGLYVGASYEVHNLDQDPNFGVAGISGNDSESAFRLAANYKWNDWKFAGMFQRTIDTGFVNGNDQDLVGGGVEYRLGKNAIKGQVYWQDESDEIDDTDGLLYAVGVDHYLSKRTQLYVQAAMLDSGDNLQVALGGGGHGDNIGGDQPGNKPWGFALGIRHLF